MNIPNIANIPTIYLQIFVLINVFFIGVLTSIAVRHARAHFKNKKNPEPEKHQVESAHQNLNLSPAMKDKLLQASQAHFQIVLNRAAGELQRDLKATTIQLDKQLNRIGTQMITVEMKRYQTSLEELRKKTEAGIGGAQQEVADHQAEIQAKLDERRTELEAQLTEEIEAKKEQLSRQVDTKLSDAVASFLVETMGHEVDLGAQTSYITKMLDEHKDEIIKGVKGEN